MLSRTHIQACKYLGWRLEFRPELCQLGLELPKMVLCGLQEQRRVILLI